MGTKTGTEDDDESYDEKNPDPTDINLIFGWAIFHARKGRIHRKNHFTKRIAKKQSNLERR